MQVDVFHFCSLLFHESLTLLPQARTRLNANNHEFWVCLGAASGYVTLSVRPPATSHSPGRAVVPRLSPRGAMLAI